MLGLVGDNLRYRLIDDDGCRLIGYDHYLRLLVDYNSNLLGLVCDNSYGLFDND